MILRGDYLNNNSDEDLATLVEFVGEEGECLVKVIDIGKNGWGELGFKPKWYPISKSGYHQATKLPEGVKLDMKGSITMWNYRIPENGAIYFCKTKEERDSYLIGE